MNSKGFGRWGLILRVVVTIICLVAAMSGIAAAATVSGTITNNSVSKTGRIYLLVVQSMGGTSGLGVSVAPLAPGESSSYDINGVPDGNYAIFAMLDTQEIGIPHANDPTGISSPFTVSGTPVNVNVTLFDPTPPTFSKMVAPDIMPSANGVMVEFNKPSDNNGVQLADSFNVYWSTSNTPGSSAGGGMKNIVANDRGPLFLGPSSLTPDTDYYFSVAPVVSGVEVTDALSDVSAMTKIANLTGGTSISGSVNLSAVSGLLNSSTPLYMAAVDESSGVFVTGIATPIPGQTYTIPGVQPGYYSIYAILDMSNSGTFDFSTLLNRTNDKSQPIVFVPPNAPASLPAGDITLTPKNAQAKVTTTHMRSDGNDSYNLQFSVASVNRQVVNVQIGSGPQVSGPIDLSSSSSGEFWYWTQVPARPVVGDSYPITVYYASGIPASETINTVVTAVLDNFANPTYPPASGTIPSGTFPNFAWLPASLNNYFTYKASINNNGGGGDKSLPLYSLSGQNQNYLNDGNYRWDLSVLDDYGNQTIVQTPFMVVSPSTPPAINGFSKVGSLMTITGSGFDSTLVTNNSVSFNGAITVPASSVNGDGTQLTVNVPTSAVSGPIGVIVNNVAAISNSEFTMCINFSGTVQDKTGAAFTAGATIGMVENPAVSTTSSLTDGKYSIPNTLNPGIPAARPFSLKLTSPGYLDIYTQIMSSGSSITGSNYVMLTASDLSSYGVTPAAGKGTIRSRVQNMDSGTATKLAGATVTTTSKMHPDVPYTVRYTDGAENISLSASSTQSLDGMFYVLDVDEGDYVTVTAHKDGMIFITRLFVTHANAVHQGSIRGGSIATSTASLPSGNYSGPQNVTLSIQPPATAANFDIIYTINGNDPANGGSTYSTPLSISSNTTLKFIARNKNFATAMESPYNTREYNFDGAISGTVTDANGGAGIANIPVQLYDSNGNYLPKSSNTDSGGNYTLSGLTSDNYRVCFYSGSTNYIAQCYNSIVPANSQTATSIPVTAPLTTTDINAVMTQGGSISGTVTASVGGAKLQNINVELRMTDGMYIYSLSTDNNGFYTFSGLPDGDYKVCFSAGGTSYQSQCWNNKSYDPVNADAIAVTGSVSVTGKNAALILGGTITGRVTSNGATGIQNIWVQLRDTNGNWISGINGTMTDGSGNYTLGGIPSGNYKLYFDGNSTGYISQWFDGVADQSLATVLPVMAGNTLSGKNSVLAQGAIISGKATSDGTNGIQNISVLLYNSDGTQHLSNANTDGSGGYQFSGLQAGTYRVCFSPGQSSYIAKCYNNQVYDPSTATDITVSAPGGNNSVNVTMTQGGAITGQVTNGSSGIQSIYVDILDATNGSMIPGVYGTWTDGNGNYNIQGIPAGNIKVFFNANNTSYSNQWHNNKTTITSADPVSISAGATTNLVTAVLPLATVPGAPTINSIIPGNGYAQVNFTAPTSDGGMQIMDYTVTANPGNMSSSGSGSPITVYGLTNGQLYTISVTARNNLGNGTDATAFYSLPLFIITGSYIQDAIDSAADGGTIWAQSGATNLSSPPLTITKGVIINGGYNSDYSSVNGYTIIPGRVNIKGSGFKVIFSNITVK